MRLSDRFVQTVAWRAFAALSAVVTAMLSLKLFSHYLPAGVFGLVQSALLVLASLPLFDGGFRTAINRNLLTASEVEERNRLLEFIQIFNTWMAAGGLGLGVLAMVAYRFSPNAQASGEPLLFFLCLGGLAGLALLAAAQNSLLIGLGGQRHMFFLNAVAPWVNLGTLWLGFKMGWGPWAFIGSQVATGVMVLLGARWMLRQMVPGRIGFQWRRTGGFMSVFHRLKGEAFQVLICQVATTLLYLADTLLVSVLIIGPDVDRYVLLTRLFAILRSLLQSADEALWPIIAAQTGGGVEMSQWLGRLNGWMYGAIMSAAALTLPSFILQYMGPDYAPTTALVGLFAFRSLIAGLASQPAAYLFGTGRFSVLAGSMGRELGLGVVLGWLGLQWFGLTGVAGGFLLATLGGTLIPLPVAYARLHQWPALRWLARSWSRAGVAMLIAGVLAAGVAQWVNRPTLLVVGAGIAVGAALAFGLGYAWWRGRAERLAFRASILRYL